jgi:hypothetical protein
MSTSNHRVEQAIAAWVALIPAPVPSEKQFHIWASGHTDETVFLGIEATAKAFDRLESGNGLIRYASACMNNRTRILERMKEKRTQ